MTLPMACTSETTTWTVHVSRHGEVIARGHLTGRALPRFLRIELDPGDRVTMTSDRGTRTYLVRNSHHPRWTSLQRCA